MEPAKLYARIAGLGIMVNDKPTGYLFYRKQNQYRMSSCFVTWKYQGILLLRNRSLLAGLLFLFIAGLYGARYGKHFVTEQKKVIYSVDTLEERSRQQVLQLLNETDTAKLTQEQLFPGWEYYQSAIAGSKTVVYRPSAFAALSIGQKDNYPYYHEITSGWYPADFYSAASTDIQNPVKLLTGNFDLAFVIIYLVPLVIIAMGYNALSSERENNTFTLLRVQTSVSALLHQKLIFQATLLILVSIIMNACAFWITGLSVTGNAQQVAAWLFITTVYIGFWYSIVYLVASLQLPSSTNALLLGGLWIVLLLLLPSTIHKIVSTSHEKELVQGVLNQRGDLPTARDLDPGQLKDSFNRLQHPYTIYPMNDTGEAAQYFYKTLMVNELQVRHNNALGRKVVMSQQNEYKKALNLNWINPVFAIQNAFNQVAATEINNYHDYLAAAEEYQTQRRYFLYQYSMQKKAFGAKDFEKLPLFTFENKMIGPKESISLLLPVLFCSVLLIAAGLLQKRRDE